MSDITGRGIDVCLSRAFILVWFLVVPASAAAEVVRVAMPTEGFLYMPLYIAVDGDWLYLFGIEDDKWSVERRRKSDGALGEVTATARTIESKKKK